MIHIKTGDLFSEDSEALVNTVNCVGVMGRGIALQFKKTFPENFTAYAEACKRREVEPGRMFVFDTGRLTNPRFIINFPTKRHWRGKSRIEDIDTGLEALVGEIRDRGIRSIAIPPLGSGLGGLNWSDVRPRIEAAMAPFEHVQVVIFEPGGAPKDGRANRSRNVPKMTPGRASLVGLIHLYLQGLLDPSITLLELHKLMYFMQMSGEPLRLRFTQGHYGPYAENLRHVLNAVEGHFVAGYADGGDRPDKQIHLVPGALEEAQSHLKGATKERFEKVGRLVEGFESPFGLELLSTVHWVATQHGTSAPDRVTDAVYAWNERKAQFSARQIHLAIHILTEQDWLEADPNNQQGIPTAGLKTDSPVA